MTEARIVIDPLTRIEGHLRVEALMGEDGRLSEAFSTGTMWRGLEVILKGRDPRDAWAFAERICGVCTGVHALAAVRAVEDAIGIQIPKNAVLARNLMNATLFVQDHVTHFYQLHALDWVDIVSALGADPSESAAIEAKLSPRHRLSSPGYFRGIQQRLKAFFDSGQLSIFKNGYWGHRAMKLPPAVNLIAAAHYLEALDFQREVIKAHTILGGKNPHPSYLVGGIACPVSLSGTGAAGNGLNEATLNCLRDIARDAAEFVNNVYLPDLKALAAFYPEWARMGGYGCFLCYGDFPEAGSRKNALPAGAVLDGRLEAVMPVDPRDPEEIQEFVDHSWFEYAAGRKGLHPWEGETVPRCELRPGAAGGRARIGWLSGRGKYSWIKAPRWKGRAMEVGPLARLAVGIGLGVESLKEPALAFLKELGLPLEALFSTLGRTVARGLESAWAAGQMIACVESLSENIRSGDESAANMEKWEPEAWPRRCRGAGLCEAPRGALGHWCVIEDGRIERWQAVVPTTWNASPRTDDGETAPFEACLRGTPIADPKRPLEILRTIHSFDPCLACATHLFSATGEEIAQAFAEEGGRA